MSDYDPKKDIGAAIRLLSSPLEKLNSSVRHLDTQTNILIGLSSAIFAIATSQLTRGEIIFKTPLLLLAIFSALAAITGIFAVHPPRFMRKRGQEESLFYQKEIEGFVSPAAYAVALEKKMGDIPAITEEYAKEIWNIARYYYRPKRKLFNLARNLLLWGIVGGVVLLSLYAW